MKSFVFPFELHWCLLKVLIDNNDNTSVLGAKPLFDAKPLSEQMLDQFTDAYMLHWGERR